MKDFEEAVKKVKDADVVIDCGEYLIAVRIPVTASSETQEKVMRIVRRIMRSEGIILKNEPKNVKAEKE